MKRRKLTKEERELVEMLHREGDDEAAEELALRLETEREITDPAEIKRLQEELKRQLGSVG